MLTDRWMDDGQKVITIAHPEHSSGKLKIKFISYHSYSVLFTLKQLEQNSKILEISSQWIYGM